MNESKIYIIKGIVFVSVILKASVKWVQLSWRHWELFWYMENVTMDLSYVLLVSLVAWILPLAGLTIIRWIAPDWYDAWVIPSFSTPSDHWCSFTVLVYCVHVRQVIVPMAVLPIANCALLICRISRICLQLGGCCSWICVGSLLWLLVLFCHLYVPYLCGFYNWRELHNFFHICCTKCCWDFPRPFPPL